MYKKCFMISASLLALAVAGSYADDLTDYLPLYNLEHTRLIPRGTCSIVDDKRDYDDYQACYEYDEKGHLIAIYCAGWNCGWGSSEQFNWSHDGRLLSSTKDAHGSDVSFDHYKTTFTTDERGRVTGYKMDRSFSSPPQADHVKLNELQCTYTYDAQGNCTKVTIMDDGKDFDFDRMGAGDPKPTFTEIKYEYNPKGQLLKAVETVNGKEVSSQTFEYDKGSKGDFLKRSVYRTQRYEEGPEVTLTFKYLPFGEEVPSGYVKVFTYPDWGSGPAPTATQTRIFNGVPLGPDNY